MSILLEDSFLISLNSANATPLNSTYNSDVVFNTNGILTDERNITYVEIGLVSAQIPVSFYAVSYADNTLNYQISAVDYSLTITPGNYNTHTFITELQARFTANGHAFAIALNGTSGVLTFTFSQDFTFLETSTCGPVFGFAASVSSTSSALTMPHPMNLLGQTQLKICSRSFPTRNIDTTSVGTMLAAIPISVASYGLIAWENPTGHKNILNTRSINQIDIQILDQDSNLINFNGAKWTLTIKITVHRNITLSTTTLTDILFPVA